MGSPFTATDLLWQHQLQAEQSRSCARKGMSWKGPGALPGALRQFAKDHLQCCESPGTARCHHSQQGFVSTLQWTAHVAYGSDRCSHLGPCSRQTQGSVRTIMVPPCGFLICCWQSCTAGSVQGEILSVLYCVVAATQSTCNKLQHRLMLAVPDTHARLIQNLPSATTAAPPLSHTHSSKSLCWV